MILSGRLIIHLNIFCHYYGRAAIGLMEGTNLPQEALLLHKQ